MSLATGTRFGPYELIDLMGVGGMGEVYRARDVRLGRDVALKTLPSGFAAAPQALQRFQRESRALSALSHPTSAKSSILVFRTVSISLSWNA